MALTDTETRKAKPTLRPYRMPDGRGLFLYVTTSGGKLWRWKYRFKGLEKLMSLGSYPDVSLRQARENHSEGMKLLRQGIDPMAARKSARVARQAEETVANNSFAVMAGLWHDHWRVGKSARYADTVKRRLSADILPMLGTMAVTEIEAPALVSMVKSIEQRGAGDLAKRALQTVGQVFRYAIANGHAKRNPAADIRPSDVLKQVHKKNYSRIDARELTALLRAIEIYKGSHVTRLAMKLIALTFVRTSELIYAKWAEINFEKRRWEIPGQRMKMRMPHIVPLARQALDILELLRSLTGQSEWLFPGDRNPNKPMSNNTILKALERMGYKHRMTGHGFRGLASTTLHELGYPPEHIELQLAHAAKSSVSAAYNHAKYLEPRTKMMQAWADLIEKEQRKSKESSEILSILRSYP